MILGRVGYRSRFCLLLSLTQAEPNMAQQIATPSWSWAQAAHLYKPGQPDIRLGSAQLVSASDHSLPRSLSYVKVFKIEKLIRCYLLYHTSNLQSLLPLSPSSCTWSLPFGANSDLRCMCDINLEQFLVTLSCIGTVPSSYPRQR